MTVKFVNRSGKKVLLFKIDKKGRHKKVRKLKDSKSETVETYETTAFIAFNMKDDAEIMVIGDNAVYFASQAHSQVDIRREPGWYYLCLLWFFLGGVAYSDPDTPKTPLKQLLEHYLLSKIGKVLAHLILV